MRYAWLLVALLAACSAPAPTKAVSDEWEITCTYGPDEASGELWPIDYHGDWDNGKLQVLPGEQQAWVTLETKKLFKLGPLWEGLAWKTWINEGEKNGNVWVGLPDYDTGHWRWRRPNDSFAVDMTGMGEIVNDHGESYVTFMLVGPTANVSIKTSHYWVDDPNGGP